MQTKLAICHRIKGRTCRDSHRISEGIHEIMPARAACRNERLLQRMNQQVTLAVRQDSTHCSICSRLRQWGTISSAIGRNGSIKQSECMFGIQPQPVTNAPMHFPVSLFCLMSAEGRFWNAEIAFYAFNLPQGRIMRWLPSSFDYYSCGSSISSKDEALTSRCSE